MTDRSHERLVDDLTAAFLEALDSGDLETAEQIWTDAEDDADLRQALFEAALELSRLEGEGDDLALHEMLQAVLQKASASWQLLVKASGPLTVSEVAAELRRSGLPGLSAADLAVNDRLLASPVEVPGQLGLSAVLAWGSQFGNAPESYWRAFRRAALALQLRRESSTSFQLAARPQPPREGGRP